MNSKFAAATMDRKLNALVEAKIAAYTQQEVDRPFFQCNIGDVARKLDVWKRLLPRVEPHYAVKCNEDLPVLATLAQLGTGFDCASKAELEKVLSLGVHPSRVIFANCVKMRNHVKFARSAGVDLMTFDNESELEKIHQLHPDAKLVIRILPPDDTKAQCQLGMKFGCPSAQVPHLLGVAQKLDLDVVGVSFHVGSGCYDASAYVKAVVEARRVFDVAASMGFHFDLLDIGGGFPGHKGAPISFVQVCAELGPALDKHFPADSGVRIISEPGRYFVASAFTLAVKIISVRCEARDKDESVVTPNDQPKMMYYVNDGVYGSFNCLLFDHAVAVPSIRDKDVDSVRVDCSVWGPTCDGMDCLHDKIELPLLREGDWLVYEDMGAYTMSAASEFNGIAKPDCYYWCPDTYWSSVGTVPNGSCKPFVFERLASVSEDVEAISCEQ